MKNPKFIIYTGPMFGSKTTKLLSYINRAKYKRKIVEAYKPVIDNRYAKSEIVSHTGLRCAATFVSIGQDIIDHISTLKIKPNIIAIDEAFMIKGIADTVLSLYKEGFTIVISSITLTESLIVFPEMKNLLPFATKVKICSAICEQCDKKAYNFVKKPEIPDEIIIGGSDVYEARCWEHFYLNK